MSTWINYHHLLYFKTIAEAGSISGAAEKLRLGQPTLSAQLKQLEEQLGVQLFHRKHKRLILTEHGKLALDYARNIFQLGGEMYEALHDRLNTKINLQLGALDSIPKQLMLQLAQAAQKVSPCTIALQEGRLDELIGQLQAHRIDILISNFLPRSRETRDLSHRMVSRRPISIYGSPRYKHLRKNFPQSLGEQPFVLPTFDSQIRYDFEHWLERNQLSVDIVAETQDIALKKLMAINDMALIPAATHAVEQQLEDGELIEIGPMKGSFEEIYLITANRKIKNPVASGLFETFTP